MTEDLRSPAEIRELASDLVSDPAVQDALPLPDEDLDPEIAQWILDLIELLGEIGAFKLMLIIIGVVLFAFFVLWVRGRILDRRAALRPVAAAAPKVTVSAKPLADARALAVEGEYANAIHHLLLQTIEELRRQTKFEDRKSWTSREVLERSKLPPEARRIFERIVLAVEEHYFGTRIATSSDFERCAEAFEEFRRATGGSA